MKVRSVQMRALDRSTWRLVLLAPALILGIIGMHSVLAQAPMPAAMVMSTDSAAVASQDAGPSERVATAAPQPDGGQPGHEGAMPDCGGLLAMCLALVVSLAALVVWRVTLSHRVLWLRPPPTSVLLGVVRTTLEQLTPLQRTTVLRC